MVKYYETESQCENDLQIIGLGLMVVGIAIFLFHIFGVPDPRWVIQELIGTAKDIIKGVMKAPEFLIVAAGLLIIATSANRFGCNKSEKNEDREDNKEYHGIDKRWTLAGINSKKELVFATNLEELFGRAGEELVDSGAYWGLRMLTEDRSHSIYKHIFISKELLEDNAEGTDEEIEQVLRRNNIIETRTGATAHKGTGYGSR